MRVLLVDDDEPCRSAMGTLLRFLEHSVEEVASAEEALVVFDPHLHDLVITDHLMPRMTGMDLAAELKRRSRVTPIVLCSAWAELNPANTDALLPKPASLDEFRDILGRFLGSDTCRSDGSERDAARAEAF